MESPKPYAVISADPLAKVAASIVQSIEAMPAIKEELEPMPEGSFDCDLLVIGAGPGGYVAAIRAAQLGGKVVCVEKEHLGGTCLNVGCIPSKAMIASSEAYQHAQHLKEFGINVKGEISYDFKAIQERKDKIVQTLRGGIGALFKKNGVRHVQGTAAFTDSHTVQITNSGGGEVIRAKNVLIATGSRAIRIPIPGTEKAKNIWTSDDAVAATHVPTRLVILGGGAVGLEFAYVFNSLGSKVTVVELMDRILPFCDADISKELDRSLTRQGIKIYTSSSLEQVEQKKDQHICSIKTATGVEQIECDVVLLGVGREAVMDELNLGAAGVEIHRKGIKVQNDRMQTSLPHIYAIGDVTGNIQLAHVASMEGIVAASNAMGTDRHMDYRAVPNCVYTVPEVAMVGLTEQEAKDQGYDVKVGKFQFRPLGRSMAANEREGIVKIVAESKYDEVLGVHIMGPHATSLIHEGVTAIKLEATVESMVDTIHAHPTFAEALLEAFEDVHGKAVHKV